MDNNRSTFGSKFGAVMALAGSAVGLGNIWKFPYITGENGGGAFLLVYLIFIAMVGIPLMLTEFALGRRGGKNVSGTFKKLAPGTKWHYFGVSSVVCCFIILSYYGTIAGWTVEYVQLFIKNSFHGLDAVQIQSTFNDFVSSPVKPVLWQVGFIFLTGAIIIGGVEKGIERYSKILMPFLFFLVVIMSIKACTLDGAKKGLEFLFTPDFSKLGARSVLIALGHSFFSLSAGLGILLTYGSYLDKKTDLVRTAIQVGSADTIIAILAGLTIFPAVFAFGMQPNAGPGLIFLTLPNIFGQMSFGAFWGFLFFILVSFAALTSTISLMEMLVAFVIEELHMNRVKATILTVITISIVGVLSTLSFGPLGGYSLFDKSIFDIMDFVSSSVLLPIGGLYMCFFAAWVLKKKDLKDELTNGGTRQFRLFGVYIFLLKYILPLAILIIMLDGLGVF